MKRLLVATVLLSSTTYGYIDTVFDIRQKSLSGQASMKKQESHGRISLDETDSIGSQTWVKRFLLPFVTAARRPRRNGKESWQDSLDRKSKSCYPRCHAINRTIIVSVNVREPFEKRDRLASYNHEKCAYYREQGWKMENPMYVEEPGWIEITNDHAKGKLPLLFESIDPFVLSRGKRIYWSTNDASDAEQNDRIRTKYLYSIMMKNFYPSYTRSKRFNDPNRSSTRKMTREPRPLVQTKRDLNTANGASTNEKDGRILERRNRRNQRNQRLAIPDILEHPHFILKDKKAKRPYRILEYVDTCLFKEKKKRKKSKVQVSWNEHDGRDVSNEFILSRETKGSLLDRLLAKSDLFYANRGKRIPSKITESMILIRFRSIPSIIHLHRKLSNIF